MRTPGHPHEEHLWDLAAGQAPAAAAAHARACRSCGEAVLLYRELKAAARPAALAPCPDPLALVDLAALPARERTAAPAAAHLTACRDCALEIEGLVRLAAGPRPPVARGTARATPSLVDRLRALVAFDLPMPLALNPRGARREPPGREYRRGIAAYRRRRFGEAARALERARKEGDRTPGLHLYLGVLHLRAGRTDAGARVLAEAARARPLTGESRWFLAQARLVQGRGREALAELRRAARSAGPYRAAARELVRRVESVLAGKTGRRPRAAATRERP